MFFQFFIFHFSFFIFHFYFYYITGRPSARAQGQEVTQISSVVEKLSLDYLVDEKRKAIFNDYGGNGEDRSLKPMSVMEIRKSILGEYSYYFNLLSYFYHYYHYLLLLFRCH